MINISPYISKMYKALSGKQYWGLYSADNHLLYMADDPDKLIDYANKLNMEVED